MKKRGKISKRVCCKLSDEDKIKIILISLLLIFLVASPWTKFFWQSIGKSLGCGKTTLFSPEEPTLLAHYSFEGNAYDSTGNYNGTLYGNPQFTDGISGQTLQFDGIDDYANLGKNLADIGIYGGENGVVTASAWVKPEDVDKYNMIIQGAGFRYLSAGASGNKKGKIIAMVKDTTNNKNYWPISNSKINSNEWTFVTFAFEGGKGYKIYINGNLDNEIAEPNIKLYSYLTKAFLGKGTSAETYFKGEIDEVKIWNYALTEDEIKREYEKFRKESGIIALSPVKEEFQTNNIYMFSGYDFENNKVVWIEGYKYDSLRFKTKVIDLTTRKITAIQNTSNWVYEAPTISDNRVVWETIKGSNKKEVYYEDLGNIDPRESYPTIPKLASSYTINTNAYPYGLDLYEDKLVYSDNAKDVYMYDFSTDKVTKITADPELQTFPIIYDNNILWEESGHLYLCNLNNAMGNITKWCETSQSEGGGLRKITKNTIVNNNVLCSSPLQPITSAHKNKAVYGLFNRYLPLRKIIVYDLESGEESAIEKNISCGSLKIYEDFIAWMDLESRDIYLYSLKTAQEIKVTDNQTKAEDFKIYGDTIIWRQRIYDKNKEKTPDFKFYSRKIISS